MKNYARYTVNLHMEDVQIKPPKPVKMTLEERYFMLMMIDYPTALERAELQKVKKMLREKEGK